MKDIRLTKALEILRLLTIKLVIMDCYTEYSKESDVAYIRVELSEKSCEKKYSFEEIKELIKKAAVNIPTCATMTKAGVSFCGPGEENDSLCFIIEVKIKSRALSDEKSICLFNEIAHSAFNTDMEFIS